MGDRRLWVSSAKPEEQGSFCDSQSGHHYLNTDASSAQIAIDSALNNRIEPIVVDAPADPDDSYGLDQRFNLYHSETDSRGMDSPAKHKPGR